VEKTGKSGSPWPGASMFGGREVFEDIGLLDEGY
jgi:hypothetical protein